MRLHDMFYDRQTESGAAEIARARFVDSIETFSEPGQILFRNSRTGVAYGDFDLRRRAVGYGTSSCRQSDCAAGRRVFDRIVYEVDKELLQTVQVALKFRQVGHNSMSETDVFLGRAIPKYFQHPLNQVSRVERLERQLDVARFEVGKSQ